MNYIRNHFTALLQKISIFCIFFFPLSSFAQVTFSNKKGCYTDHTLHFHWQLPKELKWEFTDGIEQHTVFRATSPYGVTVTINLRPVEGWDNPDLDKKEAENRFYNIENQKKAAKQLLESINFRYGCTYKIISIKECRFAGQRAIKEISHITFEDDARSENSYHVSYRMVREGAIWQISATIDDTLWKVGGDAMVKEMFRGFYFLSNQKRNR